VATVDLAPLQFHPLLIKAGQRHVQKSEEAQREQQEQGLRRLGGGMLCRPMSALEVARADKGATVADVCK